MPRRKPVHPQPLKREKGLAQDHITHQGTPSTGSNTVTMATRVNDVSPPSTGRKPLLRQPRAVSRMKSVSDGPESSPGKEERKDAEETAETPGGAGDSVQRNLSLEALFQVTHSELKNISRTEDDPGCHGDSGANGSLAAVEGPSVVPVTLASVNDTNTDTPPVLVQLETVPAGFIDGTQLPTSKELTILSSRVPEEEEMIVDDVSVSSMRATTPQQLQICVEVATTPPEPHLEVELSDTSPESKQTMVKLPRYQLKSDSGEDQRVKLVYTKKKYDQYELSKASPDRKHSVVKLPVSGKGVEKYQVKSDSLEEQGLKLTYTKKTYDQYEPNPISYGTYKPRAFKSTPQVAVDPALQEAGSPQVGRKRKYPAKPGRHICQFCGRGCAKPSVLQKHIRAHTGERPYPCTPCGFSFKTKSNLYKHCKSRAHAIKAGLTPSVDDPNKDPNKSRDGSFCEDGESDMESEDGRMSDSSTRDGSSRSTSVETGNNPPSVRSSFDSVRSRSKDEPYTVQYSGSMEVSTEDAPATGEMVRTPEGSILIINSSNGSPQMLRTSRVYKTDKQYFDIKQDVRKAGSPVPNTPLSESSHVPLTKITVKQPSQVNSSLVTTASSSDHLNVTSVVQKESDNLMKVTIKYPKVTKQQAISFDQNTKLGKSLSVGSAGSFRRSTSLPEHAHLKLESALLGSNGKDSKVVTPEAVRERLIRLQACQQKAASVDHKSMTPDMIGERISQLISNNAALLDMPMADAPRPKRMSRQNSEVKTEVLSTPSRGILSPSLSLDSGSANRLIFQGHGRAKSMDVKMPSDTDKIKFVHQDSQGHFLSQAEPTDQPPGATGGEVCAESRMTAELVDAAKTATPVAPSAIFTPNSGPSTTLPQEMRIQIKLPKSATTDCSASSVSTTMLSSAPTGLPDASQSYIGQPSVLLPNSSGVLMHQLPLPHLSLTQQQAADSSVIRELLLKSGHVEQLTQQGVDTPNPPGPPNIQMVEIRPDGSTSVINDFTPVVMMDSKGVTTTTYMTPLTQDPVAMNVGQDVEVVATGGGLHVTSPRSQLKRAMSLPQGIPMASGSSSPYENVVFDHYDPKVPPKRGRPKGSKNRVREQLSLNIPNYGVGSAVSMTSASGSSPVSFASHLETPFLTSQSLNSSPAVVSVAATRPSLRLTIPQPSVTPSFGVNMGTPVLTASSSVDSPNVSLTKLKLKGKLLMKRSMSVERMLSQEREKRSSMGASMPSMDENIASAPVQGISSPAVLSRSSSTLLTPTSYICNPLLRAASADEATPLKKRRAAFQSARSEDSPIRRLLGHYSLDSMFHSTSTDVSGVDPAVSVVMATDGLSKSHVPCALPFDSPEKKADKLPRVPSLSRQDSLPIPARIPTKLSPLSVMVMPPPTIVVSHGTAPTNQYQPFNHQQQPFMAPLLQLSRAENMHLPQSLYLSLKLSPNASNIMLSKSLSLSEDKDEAGRVLEKVESQQSVDSIAIDDSSERPTLKKLSSEGDSMDSVGSGQVTSVRRLTDKGVVKVLLMGHQCPTLRMLTHTTFCTLAKPQPMYVPQEANKLSMYSNWRAARFNPNPSGLSSRDLMSLHHMRRCDNDPYYTSPTMGPSKTGVLTHSSYWNYYNKMRALQTGDEVEPRKDGQDEVKTIKQVPEVKMATGIQVAEEQEKMLMQVSAPNVAMETVVITTPALAKQKNTKEPKRLKIFAGGYKTNEEYIYIRGRGRGKYVCEECGIRCKKPSMLRKHIRTHTDVRPYHCKHCTFSFKTKGNLTKHMKSKAHQKKCIELGITPVPVIVDDSQIDPAALALQAQMAKDGRMPSEDDDGEFSEGDDEDDDEEDEEWQETMQVVDAITGEVKETISCQVVRNDSVNSSSEGPHYVAIQEGDSGQPTLVKIEAKTQDVLMQHDSANEKEVKTEEADEGEVVAGGPSDDPENDAPRPSIDKEIAHSLLDLSKGNEPAKKSKGTISLETRRLLRQHSAHAAEEKEKEEAADADDPDGKGDGTRLDSLIGALISRTKGPGDGSTTKTATTVEAGHHGPPSMVRMATTIYQSAVQPLVRGQPSTSDLQHIHRRAQSTYAQKIAALQTANENDRRVTLSRSRVNATGSGFVPPVLVTEVIEEVRTSTSSAMTTLTTSAIMTSTTTSMTTTPSTKSMLRRQASVGGLSTEAEPEETQRTEAEPKAASEERPMNLSIDKDDGVGCDRKEAGASPPPLAGVVSDIGESGLTSNGVPINRLPDAPPIIKDGNYTCPFCDKVFSEFSQYAYHKNIHYIERTHRCDECSLAFRTKVHLKKHMRSEVHQNKQTVNQQYGTPCSENPRPFKCDDCKIAFRIHGHLAKHVRSKSHIATLQKLGKTVPEGAAASDPVDSDIEVLEEDMSMDTDEDPEMVHASTKQSNLEHALKDPENILQPRETTPVPQEMQTMTSVLTTIASSSSSSSSTITISSTTTQLSPRRDSQGSNTQRGPADGLESDQFHYHKLGDYEKDFSASNEKVTVEKIKVEPIDIGTFSSLGPRVEVDPEQFVASVETPSDAAERVARNREVFRHQAGSGSGEQHPHKCGICSRTFRAISTLKQHLVTHAELRPYVCEYCDAGFTTAQSLKFHLRTHTQGRPYICGQCGDTFARSDNLREHMHFHEEGVDEQQFVRTQKAPASARAPAPTTVPTPAPTTVPALTTVPAPTTSSTPEPFPALTLAPVLSPVPAPAPAPAPALTPVLAPAPGSRVESQSQSQPVEVEVMSSGTVAGSPVILTTPLTYPSIKPRLAGAHQSLRPAQGQLLRSASADQHLVRDILPKGCEVSSAATSTGPLLISEVPSGARRRRMAFTSSISLPLQSAAFQPGTVQFVPMIQSGQPGELIQLVQQPLGMRMPMIQVQNTAGTPGAFSGQLQTMLTPSSSPLQTLLLQSPMVLSSMPVIQQLATPTVQAVATPTQGLATPTHPLAVASHHHHPLPESLVTAVPSSPVHQPTSVVSTVVMTTPTITITTPTRVTVNADDHEQLLVCSIEPGMIPTVVMEKEEEDGSNRRALPEPGSSQVPQVPQVPQIPQAAEEQTPPPPPLHVMTSPVITITPPDGQTVTEHVPTPLPSTAPDVSLVSQPQPLGPPFSAPVSVSVSATVSEVAHAHVTDAGTGRRTLATRLIPENGEAQERLVMALEEQGLCHDKVRVVPINDDNTEFMIVQLDDINKLDDRAIEELINQNKAQLAASQHMESAAAGVAVTSPAASDRAVTTLADDVDPAREPTVVAHNIGTDDEVPESVVVKDVMLKEVTILASSTNTRRKPFLKRQHSVDLADHSAGGMRTTTAHSHTHAHVQARHDEPHTKVRVTENSHGECIPQPVTLLETEGKS